MTTAKDTAASPNNPPLASRARRRQILSNLFFVACLYSPLFFMIRSELNFLFAAENVIELRGTWHADGLGDIQIPGNLLRKHKPITTHLRYSRPFSLSQELAQTPMGITFGGLSIGPTKVFINEKKVGEVYTYDSPDLSMAWYLEIPEGILRAGTNTITFEQHTKLPGISFRHLRYPFIAPRSVLEPLWRTLDGVTKVLPSATTALLVAVMLLTIGILSLDLDPELRRQVKYTLLAVAHATLSSLYLTKLMGILITDPDLRFRVIWALVFVTPMAHIPLAEIIILRRITWFPRLLAIPTLAATVGLFVGNPTFLIGFFGNILGLMALYMAAIALIHSRQTPFGLALTLAYTLSSMSLGYDITSYLGFVPFIGYITTMSFGFFALIAGAATLQRIAEVFSVNRKLTATLTVTNENLEKALAQAHQAAIVKDQFLAATSHELRTPLNSIINIPRSLLQRFKSRTIARCETCGSQFELEHESEAENACPDCGNKSLSPHSEPVYLGSGAEHVQALQTIERSGSHLLGVVEDILDVTRIAAGRLELHRQEVVVQNLIDDSIDLLRGVAAQRQIQFSIRGDTDAVLDLDPLRMRQVIVNVLGNALKFSPAESCIEITVAKEPADVRIQIRDYGPGIPEKDLEAIFERFRQTTVGKNRTFGGAGLGLHIAREMVNLHGGTIKAGNAPGGGSLFTIRLSRPVGNQAG